MLLTCLVLTFAAIGALVFHAVHTQPRGRHHPPARVRVHLGKARR